MTDQKDNHQEVRSYHAATSHGERGFAPGPGVLDWANQPDPFRRYAGAELLPLPLTPGPAEIDFSALDTVGGIEARPLGPESLSLFLELSMGLTAWKSYQGNRWALRANASSGNLHPTECTLAAPAIPGLSEQPGIYHYAPLDHGLERLATPGGDGASMLAILSSVHWREAWKYGERAYRYCQLDAGHALGSIAYAAALLGWRARLLPEPSDEELAGLAGLDQREFAPGESEVPDFAIKIDTGAGTSAPAGPIIGDWQGTPNRLSRQHVRWRGIEAVDAAAAKPRTSAPSQSPMPLVAGGRGNIGIAAVDIIRRRRSAVAMDGATSMGKDAFLSLLGRAMPQPGAVPWNALPHAPSLSLAIFVHRVDGLPPGLYLLARNTSHAPRLRAACDAEFAWAAVADGLPLYLLREGDMRDAARSISCGQDIAADGAFAMGMIADFEAVLKADGPCAYRRLHWEAGLIGQMLYLEAEAAGLRATGIGCYFDGSMRDLLGLTSQDWQSLYHFTIGGAVEDERLETQGGYHHLGDVRRS
ncbi:MAG: SagB/ThcOx family dehydrogenase [Rhodospirillaceae bacterium]|nr:SagB/ThcOx family dehydrogenase [Rhodospirillaceae bacterium]